MCDQLRGHRAYGTKSSILLQRYYFRGIYFETRRNISLLSGILEKSAARKKNPKEVMLIYVTFFLEDKKWEGFQHLFILLFWEYFLEKLLKWTWKILFILSHKISDVRQILKNPICLQIMTALFSKNHSNLFFNNNRYFLFLQQGLFDRSRICGKVPISSEPKKLWF